MRQHVMAAVYVGHGLTPEQVVDGIALSSGLTEVLKKPIRLQESTANWPLGSDILLRRLLEPDWIEFDSGGDIALDIWVTKLGLLIEFLDPDYHWENMLRRTEALTALQSRAERLARKFGSRCALVAPSTDLRSSVAREFFCEAISIEELIARVGKEAGPPFNSIDDARAAMERWDADIKIDSVNRGYFVWCW